MPFLDHNEAENLLALRRLESRFSSRYREYPSDPRRRAIEAPVITCTALSSSKELPPVSIRIPLPEPTPPLESGNKEATLIGWGTAVPGVRSPFKATVIPLVRDSHPLFS